MLVVIDGVEISLDVVEDTSSLGVKTKPQRITSWLPPSPFSTEPNSPATAGDDILGADIDCDLTDGGPDDVDGGYSNHGSQPHSLQMRRDQ